MELTALKLTPRQKQIQLEIECKMPENHVKFISGSDSLEVLLREGTFVKLYLVQKQDTVLVEITGIPRNVNFTDTYIKQKSGITDVEIPEVHELANILTAISRVGQLDSNMVDMTTPYYKEVLTHFRPYQQHAIVDTINQHIVKALDTDSYWYYYALKMNAAAYTFNANGKIVNTGVIRKMGFDNEIDPIRIHAGLLEDFARKSGFRKFYEEHQPYYNSLILTYKALNPIDQMQQWLQRKFPISYGNYRVVFSPLVGGAHAARRFKDNGFEQTLMFISRAEFNKKYSSNLNKLLNSRVVFTEIDHNFVNPTSDKYLAQINDAFSNRSKWVKEMPGTNAYSSPYMIFNEYMTFALFSLYALDTYPKQDVDEFMPRMHKQMANRRGFYRFPEFNQKLISVYSENKNIQIDAIFEEMLNWSNEVNDASN
ncbi:DUF4932 domain-containing protein [Pontibacter sp. MBLB2868]|uniref:DUF4932 domain-containing protein n=1 Tax=Pontibacter sp. MBLB2868 TaxID=3451555 RepID=UPI003F754C3D